MSNDFYGIKSRVFLQDKDRQDAVKRAEQAEAERDHHQRVAAKMADKLTKTEAELAECREQLKEAAGLLRAWDVMWDDGQEEVEHDDSDVVLGLWSKTRRFLCLLEKPDA